MAFEIFDSSTSRRAASGPMVNLASNGALKFNVIATKILKDARAKRLLVLWDADKKRIGIAPAKSSDDRSYGITHFNAKQVSQIVVRSFPKYIGMAPVKSFRIELKKSNNPDLIFEGTVPNEYITGKPDQ